MIKDLMIHGYVFQIFTEYSLWYFSGVGDVQDRENGLGWRRKLGNIFYDQLFNLSYTEEFF